MPSNADIEMRWVDAWNDVYDIVRDRRGVPCQLPDGQTIEVDACLGWLQSEVYAGKLVAVAEGWVGHERGITLSSEFSTER